MEGCFRAIQKREQPNVPAFAASIPSATYHILDVVGLPSLYYNKWGRFSIGGGEIFCGEQEGMGALWRIFLSIARCCGLGLRLLSERKRWHVLLL